MAVKFYGIPGRPVYSLVCLCAFGEAVFDNQAEADATAEAWAREPWVLEGCRTPQACLADEAFVECTFTSVTLSDAEAREALALLGLPRAMPAPHQPGTANDTRLLHAERFLGRLLVALALAPSPDAERRTRGLLRLHDEALHAAVYRGAVFWDYVSDGCRFPQESAA